MAPPCPAAVPRDRTPPRAAGRRRAGSSVGARAATALVLAAASLALAGLRAFVVSPAQGWRTARRRAPAQRPRVARNGWGDPVTFYDATVASNTEAGEGLRFIVVDAPPEVTGPFERPGQFVQARSKPDAKPSFYAVSSPPGVPGPLEFLIKDAEANAWITSAGRGDVVQLSPAQGRGFNVTCEAWTGAGVSQVGLFATGTGISPIRSAIECGALKGKVCRLYIGARTEAALGFADSFASWRSASVEVVPVLSKPDGRWTGRKGYVQDALQLDEERGEGFVLAARHGALLCGQKEMVAAVRQVYSGLGVPEDRTLLNF